MPSQKTELKTVKRQFQMAVCRDGNVPRHTQSVHTLVIRLRVLGHEVSRKEIPQRMCDIQGDNRYEMICYLLSDRFEYQNCAERVTQTPMAMTIGSASQ